MEYKITIADAVLIDRNIYFSNVSANGLFRLNVDTEQIEFIGFFPNHKIEAGFLHKRCFSYENKVIFLPAYSRNIDIYDISEREFSEITFENDIDGDALLDAVKIESDIYIFPRNSSCVPKRLNLETLMLSDVHGFDKWLDRYVPHANPEKFYRTSHSNSLIYFAINGTDLIVQWNPNNNSFKTYETSNNVINIYSLGRTCYFTMRERYGIGKLDLISGEVGHIECNSRYNMDATAYGCLFKIDKGVVAAPAYGEYIHCFDGEECLWQYRTDDAIKDKYKFYRYVAVDGDVWLLPLVIDEIHILRKNFDIHKIKLQMSDALQNIYRWAILKETLINSIMILEDERYNFHDFAEVIAEK